MDQIQQKYPYDYMQCLNTVLQQEVTRYNKLMSVISSSLKNIESVMRGMSTFTEETEAVHQSIQMGLLPELWRKYSYPTTKSLAFYLNDLVKRINSFQWWVENGEPDRFWLASFFNPNAFLSGLIQVHSRKNKLRIDDLHFTFAFLNEKQAQKFTRISGISGVLQQHNSEQQQVAGHVSMTQSTVHHVHTHGVLLHGLFLEGARWSEYFNCLDELEKNVLVQPAPYIYIGCTDKQPTTKNTYACPVYKTVNRRPESTTGQPNFIFNIDMPTTLPPGHWIKRGTALICSSDQN